MAGVCAAKDAVGAQQSMGQPDIGARLGHMASPALVRAGSLADISSDVGNVSNSWSRGAFHLGVQ
jgi:hypothetical protein